MNNGKINLIFDCDGTLVDSYGAITGRICRLFANHGSVCDAERARELSLRHDVGFCIRTIAAENDLDPVALGEEYDGMTEDISTITLCEHAEDILKNDRFRCFVFTHRGESCREIFSRLGILDYFEEIVDSSYGLARKPDGEGVDYLVEKYNLDRRTTYYVGDRTVDIECGNNAGVGTVFYKSSGLDVSTSGADVVISDLASLAFVSKLSPQELKRKGTMLYMKSAGNERRRMIAFSLLVMAADAGDAEAASFVGRTLLTIRMQENANRLETPLKYLTYALENGEKGARGQIDKACSYRYGKYIHDESPIPHPLTYFDGKPIKIDRTRPAFPVKAKLNFNGKINILTLSANISFFFLGNEEYDTEQFTSTVMKGFCDWAGDYEVFGGQKLRVVIDLTTELRFSRSIRVIPETSVDQDAIMKASHVIMNKETREHTEDMIVNHRSAAHVGIRKWSVRFPKSIVFRDANGSFSDAELLRSNARHELGHVLGLGDMYCNESDGLDGVKPGLYEDIDCYHLYGNKYYMVMCDYDVPVRNNDIEMVILAFWKNEYQRFQPDRSGEKISPALGRGN